MKLPVELMQGKQKKLRALADRRGIIAAAAMDQRGSLRKAIAQARGVVEEKVTTQELGEFKAAVTKALTPHASAILLDPEWGMEATKQRAKGCGLLLAYEASGYDNTQPGRLPSFIPGQTVRKLVEAGADGIKVLLYYTPKESAQANAYKHDWIERVGAECALHGVPFFLELVSYDPSGGSTSTPEFAVQKPQLVIESITEFAKPQYLVDVFKAEIPVNLKFVTGSSLCKGTGVYSKPQALEAFRQLGKVVQG
ncbi:MAG: tagatose 1,6-diphosphate aldolase, partial [Deinococcus sp.]|nr:tagatose 1,6-diphosphate aldolase [Deinococcus sp.]